MKRATPRLQVLEPQRRLGVLRPGARALVEYHVRNLGEAPLVIAEVRPGCPCLQVLPGVRVVPPGGRSSVDLVLRTEGLHGHVCKAVQLVSNDPQHHQVQLTVDAQVREVARLQPNYVEESRLRLGATAVRRVRVVPTDEAPGLRVLAVRSHHPGMRARALQREASGAWWFELELQGKALGEQTTELEVLTDHAQEPRLPLWVRMTVIP